MKIYIGIDYPYDGQPDLVYISHNGYATVLCNKWHFNNTPISQLMTLVEMALRRLNP